MMKNRILYLLLTLLGFATACDKEKEEIKELMYGPIRPTTLVRIQGKVTDKAGQPIKGIQVASKYGVNKVQTGADGTYDLTEREYPDKVPVIFTDIDGPANGGEFIEQGLDIFFTEADREADRFVRKNVDIQLTEKE